MDKKKVSIVIPNYNGEKLLEKNLPKVIAVAKKYNDSTEIIIVDDGSCDKSREVVKKYFPQVKLIAKEKNEGFSSACNEGVRCANGEIVVLLNTDIYPQEYFLDFLVKDFSDKDVFAVGCLDKSWENDREVLRGRGIGWFKKGFLVHARGEVDKTNTLWVSGGSSAHNRKKWLALGGFDELYNPFYWEDIDLSFRAQKRGWKVLFEAKSVVHHHHQEGAIKNKYTKERIKTIAYRNQFIFVWKNITDIKFILEHILWLPYYLVKAVVSKDFAFIKGFLLAVVTLPQVLVKKWRHGDGILSDREIIAAYKDEK